MAPSTVLKAARSGFTPVETEGVVDSDFETDDLLEYLTAVHSGRTN